MSLKWGSQLESLSYNSKIDTTGNYPAEVTLYGMMGQARGKDVKMRVALAVALASVIPQQYEVSYEHCEEIWFVRKCENRRRWETRAFTVEEMTEANQGLMNAAQTAASKAHVLPSLEAGFNSRMFSKSSFNQIGLFKQENHHGPLSLLESNYLEAVKNLNSESGEGSQYVVHEVSGANVVASVNELIHNTINPNLSTKLDQIVKENASGSKLTHTSPEGTWTIQLFKNAKGTWTVSAGK